MAIAPAFILAAGCVLGIVVLLVVVFTRGPVSRARVERFARRQRLPITPANGDRVIRYLATTRRWRLAGLLGGIVASQFVAPPQATIHFDFITIFAGWFAGALVAEVRVARLEHGSIRAASLQPRHPGRYVPRFVWVLVPAAAVVALVTGATTAVADAVGVAHPDRGWAAVWLAVALTVAVTVRAIQHAVLRRAQPLAEPDLIAADDAMRSRSLHVLAGGGAALTLFMVLRLTGTIHPAAAAAHDALEVAAFLGIFAVALLGWLVATAVSPPVPRMGGS